MPKPSISKEKDAGSNRRIVLVVDGKPVRQFYTSIFLQRLNYHVIMAKSAEDALTFMGLTAPLAIIANIDLPGMNGAELLKRVKQDPKTSSIPVIIYTSNKDPHIQQSCEQSGSAAYLRHPATLEELYVALQKAMHKPRRFIRLATLLDVAIGETGARPGKDRKDRIAVLSELGMFVATSRDLSYGSVHPFSFSLPNPAGWIIRTEGRIVYNHASEEGDKRPGVGVKFVKIGHEDREYIKDFIRQKLMDGVENIEGSPVEPKLRSEIA